MDWRAKLHGKLPAMVHDCGFSPMFKVAARCSITRKIVDPYANFIDSLLTIAQYLVL